MNKKIIVRVFGGLGNQLFIYAFARVLSIEFQVPVYLETHTGFLRDKYRRKYRLNKYKIALNNCNWIDSLFFPLQHRFAFIVSVLFKKSRYVREQEMEFNILEQLIKKNTKIFLDGYWQNEKYFAYYKNLILEDIVPKRQVNKKNICVASEMKLCNSVAIHIRRQQYADILGIEYYKFAIKQIKDKVVQPVFYVFSDDIKWCKEYLDVGEILNFITHNTNDEISELWLMSQCRHFIVANSTFSWWGAYLSNSPDKVIIFPNG